VRDVDDIGLLPRAARVGRPSALSDHHPVWVDLQVVP
jgi:hypothetical protein